jgi:hypothetical protein
METPVNEFFQFAYNSIYDVIYKKKPVNHQKDEL